jgi:hypothetical protein
VLAVSKPFRISITEFRRRGHNHPVSCSCVRPEFVPPREVGFGRSRTDVPTDTFRILSKRL